MSSVEAFTGTRHGRALAAAATSFCGIGIVAVNLAAEIPPAPMIVTTGLTLVALGIVTAYLGRVQIAVNDRVLAYRAGLGPWRRFDWGSIDGLEHHDVATAAVFGIGVPQSRSTLRHLVGAGPALRVHTLAGDDVWLSIPESLTAARLRTYRPLPPDERS